MHARQRRPDHAEVMATRIGDAAIVELANDAIGYLPTREAFAQGEYATAD